MNNRTFVDEYGDTWVTIDGIETKVGSIKQARKQLQYFDDMRKDIREKLDAEGIRDMVVEETITVDGVATTISVLPPDIAKQVHYIDEFEGTPAHPQKYAPYVPPPAPPKRKQWFERVIDRLRGR